MNDELESIGVHCARKDCKQKDFLPFECDACHEKFCLEHRTYEGHNCQKNFTKDTRAIFCPICGQNIPVKPGTDPNTKLNAHIDKGCAPAKTSIPGKFVCQYPNCKQSELMPVQCKLCKKNFCLKHRMDLDHHCPKSAAVKRADKKTQPVNNNTTPKPQPKPQPPQPQATQTSPQQTNNNNTQYPGAQRPS
eukprot:CAMPEP_0168561250 /NCGR_PEP_ID=MMETSP0413-20121227/11494_1 /TAXON_ID=136452 /ORGANISM="Filamoeba nolandi, Strain NC-AS-23-1" /LENGTH=190 /DNA_ID=CAMNT_0008592607 /DNA_START=16 /DNA_END=585 /DNA_ORIENTATION=+